MRRTLVLLALWSLAGLAWLGLHSGPILLPAAVWIGATILGLPGERILWALRLLPIGILGLSTPMLQNENRQRILEHLEEHPGASIQQVREAAGVAWGTAVYHLDRLRRQGKVVSHRQGNHHRYWLNGTPEAGMRRSWSLLEQPTARDIAMAVAHRPGLHQQAICEALDVRAPSASKHLSRLEQHGLVEKDRVSRYVVYRPTPELHRILDMRDTGGSRDAAAGPGKTGATAPPTPSEAASSDAPATPAQAASSDAPSTPGETGSADAHDAPLAWERAR